MLAATDDVRAYDNIQSHPADEENKIRRMMEKSVNYKVNGCTSYSVYQARTKNRTSMSANDIEVQFTHGSMLFFTIRTQN